MAMLHLTYRAPGMVCRAPAALPEAFGGGWLRGDNLARFLDLDEAGVGKLTSDPVMVVAAVLIDADRDWMAIARKLATCFAAPLPKRRRGAFAPSREGYLPRHRRVRPIQVGPRKTNAASLQGRPHTIHISYSSDLVCYRQSSIRRRISTGRSGRNNHRPLYYSNDGVLIQGGTLYALFV